jgi:pyrroloquinoline quinone (PQQ) biosynthesis protein C
MSYNDPEYSRARYDLTEELMGRVVGVGPLVQEAIGAQLGTAPQTTILEPSRAGGRQHMRTTSRDVQAFVADLEAEISEQRLSLTDTEFLLAVEAGATTREQIGKWAKAFYATTRNGRLMIGTFYANSPDDPQLRRELAENLYEEETGRLSGVGRCHMDVFADFLAAFDITLEQARRLPSPLGDLPTGGQTIAPEDFYIELAAYGLSVEAPNARFCERIVQALKADYGFTDDQLTWFSMHAALDADHGDEFLKYVEAAAAYDDGLERVRTNTLTLCATTKLIWNGAGKWQ